VFLTVAETAEMLRTSPKAIYSLVERGQLAGTVRIGRRVLVRRDVLLSALDGKTAASPSR
jgi:excisionase family DNA binding protein